MFESKILAVRNQWPTEQTGNLTSLLFVFYDDAKYGWNFLENIADEYDRDYLLSTKRLG